jgi:hypothetical protein
MPESRQVKLWPCGYSATCSAPGGAVAPPLRSCAISATEAEPIIKQKLATPRRASYALS